MSYSVNCLFELSSFAACVEKNSSVSRSSLQTSTSCHGQLCSRTVYPCNGKWSGYDTPDKWKRKVRRAKSDEQIQCAAGTYRTQPAQSCFVVKACSLAPPQLSTFMRACCHVDACWLCCFSSTQSHYHKPVMALNDNDVAGETPGSVFE